MSLKKRKNKRKQQIKEVTLVNVQIVTSSLEQFETKKRVDNKKGKKNNFALPDPFKQKPHNAHTLTFEDTRKTGEGHERAQESRS